MNNPENKNQSVSKGKHTLYIVAFTFFVVLSAISMIVISEVILNLDTHAGTMFGAAGILAAWGCKSTIRNTVYNFSWDKLLEIVAVYISCIFGCYLSCKFSPGNTFIVLIGIGIGLVIFSCLFLFIRIFFKNRKKTSVVKVDENERKESNDTNSKSSSLISTKVDKDVKMDANSDVSKESVVTKNSVADVKASQEFHADIVSDSNISSTHSNDIIEINNNSDSVISSLNKGTENEASLQDNSIGETKLQNSKLQNKSSEKCNNKYKMVVVGAAIVVLLVIIGIIAYHQLNPTYRYQQARENIKNGKIKEGETMLLSLANNGNTKAAERLGYYYWRGDTLKKNLTLAAKYFKIAADQNDTLGMCGYGAVQAELGNFKDGIKYFKKAYNMGFILACDCLAEIYGSDSFKGHNNPYINNELLGKYASELPDSFSSKCLYLGNYYSNKADDDDGVQKQNDYEMAFYWYRKGAKMGATGCMDNLGWMYYFGFGVKPNYTSALVWCLILK